MQEASTERQRGEKERGEQKENRAQKEAEQKEARQGKKNRVWRLVHQPGGGWHDLFF
jgi:hypothetical protein